MILVHGKFSLVIVILPKLTKGGNKTFYNRVLVTYILFLNFEKSNKDPLLPLIRLLLVFIVV